MDFWPIISRTFWYCLVFGDQLPRKHLFKTGHLENNSWMKIPINARISHGEDESEDNSINCTTPNTCV
jgi:hypothetical protein